jgi:hypothetical protein
MEIKDRQDLVDGLPRKTVNTQPLVPEPQPADDIAFTDDEIINKAGEAKNGPKFKLLFHYGDLMEYSGDDSAADLALCNLIKFWTKEAAQIDRIFRRSGLMRAKWDRTDYAQRTIEKALASPDIDTAPSKTEPELSQQEKDVINRKAYALLKNGDLMELWLDTFQEFHFSDRGIAEGILISTAIQSVLNALGLQIKVTGPSGRGKTHAARTAMHLLPQKYVQYATFTDTALWYKENLLPGSTIFSDDVELSDAQEAMIRRASSRWQVETPREAMHQGKGWELKPQVLPPRLNWLLTSVQHEGTDQLLNRQLAYEVDEGNDADYVKFALAKLNKPDFEFPLTENVLVLREAIRIIKEDKNGKPRLETIIVPFWEEIEWDDAANRRNLYMFTDLLLGFCMINFLQREQDEDENYIATKDDFNAAMHHYGRLATGQQMHIPSGPARRMIQFFQDQNADCEENGLTVNEIKNKTGIPETTVRRIIKDLLDTQAQFNEETIMISESGIGDEARRGRKQKVYWMNKKILNLQNAGAIVSLKKE